jgi:hypothetical protein
MEEGEKEKAVRENQGSWSRRIVLTVFGPRLTSRRAERRDLEP